MNWQLTEGAIDTLLTGGSVTCPVIQILGCKKIPNEERYRLLVSDGHHMSSSVVLSEKLNDKLTSGELSNYCVVRVDRFVVSKNVEAEEENHLLSILELTILAKGQEVNRKIGKLVSFTEGECDPSEVGQPVVAPVLAAVNMNWQLTEGAIPTLLAGGFVSCPVIQILGCKKIPNEERYRLLVSDGHHMSSSVVLSEKLNDRLTSGELSNYCVVRVDRFVVSKNVEAEEENHLLTILELTILAKGQEVKRKIGKLVSYTEGECDPSEVVQPVVAPVHAADYQLSEGALATLNAGGFVPCPVIQILGIKRIGSRTCERYRLLVSDGRDLNSFVMLATQLNDKVTSGELSDFSVVRVDRWVGSKVVAAIRKTRHVLIILALTILAKGQEVNRKIGQPMTLAEYERDLPAVEQPVVAPGQPVVAPQHAAVNTSSLLTEGAIPALLTGGSVTCPVIQILGSKRIAGAPQERYRLLVSDGRHLNNFTMLATQLNDKVTSGELSDFSVVRLDRWVVSELMGETTRRVLIILELTTLAKGEEVNRKIGQPVPFIEGESDPPAVQQPVVAPVHAAENLDWRAVIQHTLSPPVCRSMCAYFRGALTLPPQQLRVAMNCLASCRPLPFRLHEFFRRAADLPPVQIRAVVRRVMAILLLRAPKRRAAAA